MEFLQTYWDNKEIHFWVESKYNDYLQNPITKEIIYQKSVPRGISQILKVLKMSGLNTNELENFNENSLIIDKENPDEITTISCNPIDGLKILMQIERNGINNFEIDSSTNFLIKISKFALMLISKELFIPIIKIKKRTNETITFTGKWIQLPNSEYETLFRELIVDLPKEYQNSQKSQTKDFIYSIINQIIDDFIRNKLGVFLPIKEPNEIFEFSEIAQKWFESLFSTTEILIELNKRDFVLFNGSINAWLNNAYNEIGTKKLRTCLKLEPPELDSFSNKWNLSIFMQAIDDESLIIPSSRVLHFGNSSFDFLDAKYENPKIRILQDLAEISKLYPEIEEYFEETVPTKISLSQSEAFYFLEEIVPKLEENDFGIFLPSWWHNPAERVRLKLKLTEGDRAPTGKSLFCMNEFLKFEWQIAIGDTILTIEEFEKYAALKIPFVRIRGKWVKFDYENIGKTLQELKETYDMLTTLDALQLSLTEDSQIDDLIFEFEDNRLFDDFKKRIGTSSKIKPLETPQSFVGKLRPYQQDGFSWMNYLKEYGFGACLADDMGLGKTIQVLAFLLYEKERGVIKSNLLICPTSILGNWKKEIQNFTPSLNAKIFHGTKRPNEEEFPTFIKNTDIIITTYATALRDKSILSSISWENIILDEAQNIKNPKAKQTKAIKSFNSNYKIALTGTPIENRLIELWSILDFLNPGYLGSLKNFTERFVIPIENENKVSVKENLARIIKPFILRRLKTNPDIIKDLPEKSENNIYCSLMEEQALLYEAVVKDLFDQLNSTSGIQRKGLVLSTITKLKQICNHPAQFIQKRLNKLENRSSKFERLKEMVEEIIENNEKALIFTQYKELGLLLQKYLEKNFNCGILFLSGETPQKVRDEMVAAFQKENDHESPRLFILSIKAGGVGLNLTAANHVFHIDRWWNPAVENQATDRAFRIGQKKNVFVHKFVTIGTLEESIDNLISQKKILADSVISTGNVWLTEFSTEDLRDVLSLRSVI